MRAFMISVSISFILCCASHKPMGKDKWEVTCSGEENEQCQRKAWELCNGPFETLDEKNKRASFSLAALHSRNASDFTLLVKCKDNSGGGAE